MSRRMALKLLLCLVAGLVLNFAIAAAAGLRPVSAKPGWGCGFLSEGGNCSITLHDDDLGRTRFGANSSLPHRAGPDTFKSGFEQFRGGAIVWPHDADFESMRRRLFPPWADPIYTNLKQGEWKCILACGWPLKSFAGFEVYSSSPQTRTRGLVYWLDHGRAVPYQPILLGSAVNTSLYASPFILICIAWPRFRIARRLRRGHCPRCNYDLRAELSGGCPECGWNRPAREGVGATPAVQSPGAPLSA